MLSLLLRLQRHPLAVLSLGHLNPSMAVASLPGSDRIPFSGSNDDRPFSLVEEKREELVIVRSMRVKRETGDDEYLVLKRGLRIGRQTERMPMLHSTLTQTPTETELQLKSAKLSSARRGMRTMPAMQTLKGLDQ